MDNQICNPTPLSHPEFNNKATYSAHLPEDLSSSSAHLAEELSNVSQHFPNSPDENNSEGSPVHREKNKNQRAKPLSESECELESESDKVPEPHTHLTKRGTIRKRGLKGDTRKVRKLRTDKRNSGKEYMTKSGKIRAARKSEPLNSCRNKCSEKITNENRKLLFETYWSMESFNRRLTYIGSLLTLTQPKRVRKRRESEGSCKLVTIQYNVEIDGNRIKICKSCFLKIFGESRKFLETVVHKKRATPTGIIQLDARGTANKNEDSEILRNSVKEFLAKIPCYKSHYTRRDCDKNFLSPHHTITSLHGEYLKASSGGNNNASYRVFCEVFHSLNLCIKKPKIDTCATCDRMMMQSKVASDTNEKNAIIERLHQHQLNADKAYDKKRSDKETSKMDSSKKTLTFDLQQCLATPLLKNSISFYKRTLWTFNLTVYDCDDGQTYCYLWHEAMAARGANEIGSCLFEHITKMIPPAVKSLTMYSDSCPGQNKNSHIAVMCWTALQESSALESIDHKFLVPGHTHMECDTSHSLIERKKKSFNGPIEHPHDWAQLIRQTGKKKPFIVIEMGDQNFLDFAGLLKTVLIVRKTDNAKNPFNWRDVRWLRFLKDQPGVLFFKTSLDEEEDFKEVSFRRRGKVAKYVPEKKTGPNNLISIEKKKDLIDLLPFISPVFHGFYENLATTGKQDFYPDSDEVDE